MSSEAVREAVAAGDYPAAAALFDRYVQSLPRTEASLSELQELLQWTRVTILCAKAHAEDRARRLQAELQVAAAYGR